MKTIKLETGELLTIISVLTQRLSYLESVDSKDADKLKLILQTLVVNYATPEASEPLVKPNKA